MRWIHYALVVMVMGGIALSSSHVIHRMTSIISWVSYPFVYVQYHVYGMFRSVGDWMQSRDRMREKLMWYQQMYETLRAEHVRLQSSLAYVNAIDELVSFNKRYHQSGILAAVIFRQCNQEQHTCLINAGSYAGVQPDMIVVYKNMLVGRVDAVYPWYSRVVLITDSNCYVPVECVTSGTHGIHQGNNDVASSRMVYVNRLAHITPGDTVVTRAHGVIYPYGFGVGRVTSYTTHDVYHHVDIEPFVDIRHIDYCAVIQPGADRVERVSS